MTLAYDCVTACVVTAVAAIVHYIAVELFAPGSPLWNAATDDTAVMHGTERAAFWFPVLTVWVPLAVVFGVWAWVMVRAYKRQVATGLGSQAQVR